MNYHEQYFEKREFVVGDLVLLFNSRLRLFQCKLKSKYTSPFLITKVLQHWAVQLENKEGAKIMEWAKNQDLPRACGECLWSGRGISVTFLKIICLMRIPIGSYECVSRVNRHPNVQYFEILGIVENIGLKGVSQISKYYWACLRNVPAIKTLI